MGIVCGDASCFHTPSILAAGVRHAVVAFRGDRGVVDSRGGQMGNVWVLRPFVRTRLPVSDIDTPSPCGLEWRRWFVRRRIAPLLTSALAVTRHRAVSEFSFVARACPIVWILPC